MSSRLYFAYGSNMHPPHLGARVGPVRPHGRARLDGHRLAFDKPGRDGSAKAIIRPATGAVTWGVLFALSEAQLALLDRFEPGYQRHRLRVHSDALGEMVCESYASSLRIAGRLPARQYVDLMIRGALVAQLPPAYVQRLRRIRITPAG